MSYARRYASQQAETASPERLMVLLFEKALAQVRAAAVSLEAGRTEAAREPIGQASRIVAELSRSLDAGRAPRLAGHLKDVYLFLARRLLDGASRGDARALREAEQVLAPVASAFAEAVRTAGVRP